MERNIQAGARHPEPEADFGADGPAVWDDLAYGQALAAPIEEMRHIAYGSGIRLQIAESLALELYPERRTLRLTSSTHAMELTLLDQEQPPSITSEGLVFERTDPPRLVSISKSGSVTLFANPGELTINAAKSKQGPIAPSPTRPIVQADAAPSPSPREGKEPSRGRIEGIVVYDPVFTVSSQKQKELVRFTVAEHYTDADGEPQTVYHRCVAFNSERKRLADQVRDHAKQGDAIIVHGNWHDVAIQYRNGSTKHERQLWAYGLKITPQPERSS